MGVCSYHWVNLRVDVISVHLPSRLFNDSQLLAASRSGESMRSCARLWMLPQVTNVTVTDPGGKQVTPKPKGLKILLRRECNELLKDSTTAIILRFYMRFPFFTP
jgi:hypothetical protein